jgi:hypothetical protein
MEASAGEFMAQRIHLFLPFFLPSVGLVALCVSAGQTQHRSRDYISAETNFVRIQVTVFDDKGERWPLIGR